MPLFRPAWRLRLYAGRSVDATEQTLLVPAAGAPHPYPALFSTRAALQPNMLANPEAAVDLAGWGFNGTGSNTRVTSPVPPGFATAVQCVITGAGSGPVMHAAPGGARPLATPGIVYGFSLHVDGTGNVGRLISIVPHWYNAPGVGGGPPMQAVPYVFTLAAGWQRFTVTEVAPVGAASMLVTMYMPSGESGSYTLTVTGVQIEDTGSLGSVTGVTERFGQVGRYNALNHGYLPYLEFPSGFRSTLDPLTKKLKSGAITVELTDAKVTLGGGNADRLVTALIANAAGIPHHLGIRAEIDMTDDVEANVVHWERWWTGRVRHSWGLGKNGVGLQIVDAVDELEAARIFVGRPAAAVTYAAQPQLWPLGPSAPFGTIPVGPQMTGTIGNAPSGNGKSINIDDRSETHPANVVTDALAREDVPMSRGHRLKAGQIRASQNVVARITQLSGGGAGTVADYTCEGLNVQPVQNIGDVLDVLKNGFALHDVYVRQISGGTALPADGTTVAVQLVRPNAPPTKDAPLLINDVHPVLAIQHACDGFFGRLTAAGLPIRAFPRDPTSFTALGADPSFGLIRLVIEKEWKLKEFVETVCRQVGLGYRLDEFGRVVLFDLRIPQTLAGLTSLSDADFDAAEAVEWDFLRDRAIVDFRIKWYVDRVIDTRDLPVERGIGVTPSTAMIQSFDRAYRAIDFGRLDLGDEKWELDAIGLRALEDEITEGVPRDVWILGKLLALVEQYRNPYGYAPHEATISVHRSTATKAIREGQLLLLNSSVLPNPGTNRRGGARLVRCLERNDDTPKSPIRLRVIDMGPNVTLVAPTLGALSTEAGNTSNGIVVPVTLNGAGDPVTVQVAATDNTVAVVANVPENAWATRALVRATGNQTIKPVASGKRQWVRARSEFAVIPSASGPLKLPSPWSYPSGAGFLDMAALAAPTGLAVSQITALSALLSWSLSSVDHAVEVWLASPSGEAVAYHKTLPPGSTELLVHGTVNGATYRASVRVFDGAGFSAFATEVTWTAAGTAPICPTPRMLEAFFTLA